MPTHTSVQVGMLGDSGTFGSGFQGRDVAEATALGEPSPFPDTLCICLVPVALSPADSEYREGGARAFSSQYFSEPHPKEGSDGL